MGKQRKPGSRRWPCIFMGGMTRDVDDEIQRLWQERYGQGAPFGSLRQTWRKNHCRAISPYGSEDCPFTMGECVAAFRDAVIESMAPHVMDSRVFFISVARTRGFERAENKPTTPRITQAEGPGAVGVVGPGGYPGRTGDPQADAARDLVLRLGTPHAPHLRTRLAAPQRLSELLGSPDGGSREGSAGDGEEGSE